MSILSKFRVDHINDFTEDEQNPGKTIRLRAVIDGKENKSFSKWTPSGEVNISITNPNAFEQFHQGEEFYVVFKKVEK